MKKILLLLALVIVIAIGALVTTLLPATLEVPSKQPAMTAASKQPASDTRMSILLAGQMFSEKPFTYRGGEWGEQYVSGMAATLVQHPLGDILIDTGFGRDVDAHHKTMPKLMQMLSKYEAGKPVVDQLTAQNYQLQKLRGIFITHTHWDHVSGLPDFQGVTTYAPQAEIDMMQSDHHMATLMRSFIDDQKVKVVPYAFASGPYELWDKSHDVYGDGAVVIVPLPGHTPGSVAIFVNLASGKRFLFVGDTVWAKEAVELPAERPWLARKLVDFDAAQNREAVVQLHQLSKQYPDLVIVPAHDRRVHEAIAQYPKFEQ